MTIVAVVGALITALGGLWIGLVKARSDTQAAKGSRMDAMEARIDKMQADLDDERKKRRGVEVLAHHLWLGLATGKGYLESVIR
nr:hypothetical protein [Corynebacterium ulcerans]